MQANRKTTPNPFETNTGVWFWKYTFWTNSHKARVRHTRTLIAHNAVNYSKIFFSKWLEICQRRLTRSYVRVGVYVGRVGGKVISVLSYIMFNVPCQEPKCPFSVRYSTPVAVKLCSRVLLPAAHILRARPLVMDTGQLILIYVYIRA